MLKNNVYIFGSFLSTTSTTNRKTREPRNLVAYSFAYSIIIFRLLITNLCLHGIGRYDPIQMCLLKKYLLFFPFISFSFLSFPLLSLPFSTFLSPPLIPYLPSSFPFYPFLPLAPSLFLFCASLWSCVPRATMLYLTPILESCSKVSSMAVRYIVGRGQHENRPLFSIGHTSINIFLNKKIFLMV